MLASAKKARARVAQINKAYDVAHAASHAVFRHHYNALLRKHHVSLGTPLTNVKGEKIPNLFAHMELTSEFHEELQPHVEALKAAIKLAEEAKASSVKNTAGRRR